MAFAALDKIAGPSEMGIFATLLLQVSSNPRYVCAATGLPVTITNIDNDSSGTVSVGDKIVLKHDSCGNFARDYTLTLTTFGTSVAARVEFVETTQDPQATLSGTFDLSFALGPNPTIYEWSASAVDATLTYAGATYALRAASMSKARDSAARYQVRGTGELRANASGDTYRFATTVSQPLSGSVGGFPSGGELILTAGISRVRIAPATDAALAHEYAEYQVSVPPNGLYGAATRVRWLDLSRGYAFGYVANAPPHISSLTLLPTDADRTTMLHAQLVASDPDRDSLDIRYEWRRNGTPLALGFQATTLAPGNFVRGDEISVQATVSDGRETVTVSASVMIGNAPPRVTSALLTPAAPTVTSDIAFAVAVSDPDGDPLQVTYRWLRNGVLMTGRTTNVLPLGGHFRDDVLTAIVSVDDGFDTTEAQASVTVRDSPAIMTAIGAPTAVDYGDLVEFEVVREDPDGDPLSGNFRLDHGPAGMTVDPVSGAVEWLATPFMFDRSGLLNYSIGAEGSTSITGSIRVEAPDRDYPLARTGIEIPLWPAGLTVGDFDDDGDEEALILSSRSLYELEHDGADGYRQAWVYPFSFTSTTSSHPTLNGNATALATGDIDGDGRHEIFVGAEGRIVRLDGVERRVTAQRSLPANQTCKDLELADLDADGAAELVCAATVVLGTGNVELLVVSADSFSEIWKSAPASYGSALAVGNVDADAQLEIVTASGYVFDGDTFANQWVYAGVNSGGFGRDVDTGDLDGDGVEEIVGAADWTRVVGYSAVLRSPLWEIPRFDLDALLVTDIEGDARAEILVGDGQWGDVTAYRIDGTTPQEIFHINSQEHGVTAMGVGDVDGDGERELVWGSGATSSGADRLVVAGRNPAIEVEWTQQDPQQLDGPFVGGALVRSGAQPPQLLFATAETDSGYKGTRLIGMEPASGELTVSAELGSNWSAAASFAVSDYDGDGTDEAFLATANLYNGYLTVHDFFDDAAEWTTPELFNTAYASVTAADVTNDGHDDFVAITQGGVVYVFDAFNGTSIWQSATLGAASEVIAADLGSDGQKELVIVTKAALHVYARSAQLGFVAQASSVAASGEYTGAVVGDPDGDGTLEIYALDVPRGSDNSATLRRFNTSLQPLGSSPLGFRASDVLIEAASGSRKNLLVTTSEFAFRSRASQIVAIDARSAKEVWRSPFLIGQVSSNSIHFIPTAQGSRMSVGTAGAMYLTR